MQRQVKNLVLKDYFDPSGQRGTWIYERGLKVKGVVLVVFDLKRQDKNPIFCGLIVIVRYLGPIAQLDRASDFESEGWAFESLWDHHQLLPRSHHV